MFLSQTFFWYASTEHFACQLAEVFKADRLKILYVDHPKILHDVQKILQADHQKVFHYQVNPFVFQHPKVYILINM